MVSLYRPRWLGMVPVNSCIYDIDMLVIMVVILVNLLAMILAFALAYLIVMVPAMIIEKLYRIVKVWFTA